MVLVLFLLQGPAVEALQEAGGGQAVGRVAVGRLKSVYTSLFVRVILAQGPC